MNRPKNGKTILLVKDNADNQIIYRRALEHLGYGVLEAVDGEEGTKHIPIIALTAFALPSNRARGVEIGFASYLTKPAEPRRVLEEIERVIAERELPKP